jgi:hypothetical protein
MPFTYRIDPKRRLVIARGSGIMKDQDFFGYQQDVWSRPEVAGFDELVDMTNVAQILLPSVERVRDLAELGAHMAKGWPVSRLAIVAPGDLAFGLGRLFEIARQNATPGGKPVEVFRALPDALAWLGIKGDLE